MKEVELYVPKVEDLWFRKLCMSDEETMNYNAGYELSFSGYHYETGCIDFPEENWKTWHDEKIKTGALFYAYIVDVNTREFVGHLNFKKDQDDEKIASMGIVMYSSTFGLYENICSERRETLGTSTLGTIPLNSSSDITFMTILKRFT